MKNLNKCSNKEFNSLMQNAIDAIENSNFTEKEDDEMLAPYLIEMANRIKSKKVKGNLTLEEAFKILKSN